tara:strand:- start:1859 stop:2248 length:390 start_codon:yes stop_codon:yes gene_type:complete
MIDFSKIKDSFAGKKDYPEEFTDDYVELDTELDRKNKAKISVRPFVIEDFSDIKPALDSLREGYTIALLNIRPLKERDLVELKRAVSKVKKTCEVIDGDIAGFGDDWIVATPGFAKVYRELQDEEYPEL